MPFHDGLSYAHEKSDLAEDPITRSHNFDKDRTIDNRVHRPLCQGIKYEMNLP